MAGETFFIMKMCAPTMRRLPSQDILIIQKNKNKMWAMKITDKWLLFATDLIFYIDI